MAIRLAKHFKVFVNQRRNVHQDLFSKHLRDYDRQTRTRIHDGESKVNDFKVSKYNPSFDKTQGRVIEGGERSWLKRVRKIYTLPVLPFNPLITYRNEFVSSSGRFKPEEMEENGNYLRLPIQVDKVASFVEMPYPSFVGARPGEILTRKAEIPLTIEMSEEDRCKYNLQFIAPGTWEFTSVHLQRYTKANIGKATFEELVSCIPDLLSILPKFKCNMPIKSELKHCKINPDAYPGICSGNFYQYKSEAAEFSLRVADDIWDDVNAYGCSKIKDPSVYSCGGRARRHSILGNFFNKSINEQISEFDRSEALDARLVQQPEMCWQLVNQAWQKHFAFYFHNSEVNKNSWVWLGQTMVYRGWQRLYSFLDCATCLEGDWSDFDASVSSNLIIVAFAVIASFFPYTTKTVNFFTIFCEAFTNRRVVTPGDWCYSILQGIPSGSVWTSDIGTVVNCLIWVYIIKYHEPFKLLGYKPNDFVGAFAGDDFLLGLKGDEEWDTMSAGLEEFVYEKFGMKIKGLIVDKMVNEDDDKCLTFFKTGINSQGLPIVRTNEIVKRMNLPERNYETEFGKFEAQTVSVPAPGKARQAFIEMVKAIPCEETLKFGEEAFFKDGETITYSDVTYLENLVSINFAKVVCGDKYDFNSLLGKVDRHVITNYGSHKTLNLPGVSVKDIKEAYKQMFYYPVNFPHLVKPIKKVFYRYLNRVSVLRRKVNKKFKSEIKKITMRGTGRTYEAKVIKDQYLVGHLKPRYG